MSNHTPELWITNGETIFQGTLEGESLAAMYPVSDLEDGTEEANAHRIVACVNGCEGVNPEAIRPMLDVLKMLVAADMVPVDHDALKTVNRAIALAEDVMAEGPGTPTGQQCRATNSGVPNYLLCGRELYRYATPKGQIDQCGRGHMSEVPEWDR